MKTGKVYLIGAGPGDTGLITVKGLELLKKADVVVFDRLLDENLLNLVKPRAKKIFVGKSSRYHTLEQNEINQILSQEARVGKNVVRLKGGDPFVFGRGGEEAEFLSANHIPFEIIPGVTSAVAVPAYSGIPVTHRGLASSFAVVTGHEQSGKELDRIDWVKISQGADTLVILMGVSNLRHIVDELVKNGRPAATPIAIITRGTSTRQHTSVGTLENIAGIAEREKLEPPAVLVVGRVVELREKLRWFDNTPLFGKQVLVTRAKAQASELCQLLSERSAIPIELPSLLIEPVFDQLDAAIRGLSGYNWIIFTSVNAVEIFFQRLYHLGLDARKMGHLNIGAIGQATAASLEKRGILADCIPQRFTSRGLLTQLKHYNLVGSKILLPRADIAGKELSQDLTKMGAEVKEIAVYRTMTNKKGVGAAKQALKNSQIDIVTFTSSSTVKNLLSILGRDRKSLDKALIACIGPVTATAATRAGLKVDIIAQVHTVPALVEALEKYLREGKNE